MSFRKQTSSEIGRIQNWTLYFTFLYEKIYYYIINILIFNYDAEYQWVI